MTIRFGDRRRERMLRPIGVTCEDGHTNNVRIQLGIKDVQPATQQSQLDQGGHHGGRTSRPIAAHDQQEANKR